MSHFISATLSLIYFFYEDLHKPCRLRQCHSYLLLLVLNFFNDFECTMVHPLIYFHIEGHFWSTSRWCVLDSNFVNFTHSYLSLIFIILAKSLCQFQFNFYKMWERIEIVSITYHIRWLPLSSTLGIQSLNYISQHLFYPYPDNKEVNDSLGVRFCLIWVSILEFWPLNFHIRRKCSALVAVSRSFIS